MLKNELTLEIENIGGLAGSMQIKLKPPISIIEAPNASGKTSIIRALQLLCKNDLVLEDVLNEYSATGKVILRNGEEYFVNLIKTQSGVSVSGKLLSEDYKDFRLAFCIPEAELVQIITTNPFDPDRLKNWFRDISDARHYETAMVILNTLIQEKTVEMDSLRRSLVDTSEIKEIISLNERVLERVENELEETNKKLEELGYTDLVDRKRKLTWEMDRLRSQEILPLQSERNRKEDQLSDLRMDRDRYTRMLREANEKLDNLEKELRAKEDQRTAIEQRRETIKIRLYDDREGIISRMRYLSDRIDARSRFLKEIGDNKEWQVCTKLFERDIELCSKELKDLEEEKKRLEDEYDQYGTFFEELDRLKALVTSLRMDITDYRSRIRQTNDAIRRVEKEIEEINSRIAKLQADLGEKEKDMRKLDEEISRLEGVSEELKQRISRLERERMEARNTIAMKREELERAIRAQGEYRKVARIVERLRGFLSYMQERYEYIINGTRNELNEKLREVFDVMQYTNFSKIIINSDYNIEITRREGYPTKLSRLSSSERLTIALIMMFVAKQAYAPDFPMFVVDEVMGSYDLTRFRRILDYIKGSIPFLIVTSLAPLRDKVGAEAITVKQSL